ncbi:MAG: adenylosuccinate synthase [Salinivirgaceae bacterium]|jgi:adenylosuccinate synthase|nr:adenylosuccinate synthase [Bacteroidales bacterium]
MNKIDVLLGLQWGDEGKGKGVDVLTPNYDVVIRFQGGPNAGHSLEFNQRKHVLHLIPSGIFHPDCLNIISNGVVIDPIIFKKEIEGLRNIGVNPVNNLKISRKGHLILPFHPLLDAISENAKGDKKIGSTLKGIAPAYRDKIGREGLRVGDIERPDFKDKYYEARALYDSVLSPIKETLNLAEREEIFFNSLATMLEFEFIDSEYEINNLLNSNKRILAEGAQGAMLDIDFGSYPFVTSSNTTCGGACTGMGIAPHRIGEVIGIVKGYCTRVGSGPFPTELFDEAGQKLRDIGREYGSTTGRPRRCGWLDLVALKYVVMLNGVTQLLLTKSDVMDTFSEVKVCTKYIVEGKETDRFPFDTDRKIEPVYKTLKGWNSPINKVRNKKDFPKQFLEFVKFIEDFVNVPVAYISVGPDRDEIVTMR